MNGMRKVVCFLMVMGLAAFALPGMAASGTKNFYAAFPTFVSGGSSQTILATFYNTSPPPGLSTINSILIAPAPGVTITNISPGSPSPVGDGSWIVNSIPGIKRGGSQVFTITANVTGNCVNGSWGAAANTGNAYPQGDPFTNVDTSKQVSVCDGILACNAPFTKPASTIGNGPNDPGYVSGLRGLYNKDGVTIGGCVDVAYAFANTIPSNNKGHLLWDTASQPNAAFTYTMNFQLRSVTTGWTDAKHPQVAWLNTDGSPANTGGTPLFVPGLACLGTNPPTNLPAPYGKLTVGIGTGTGITITIDTSGVVPLPTSGPFPIVIGTERMTATFASATTLNVTSRGDGGTGPAVTHSANAPVMSTPMPIIPNDPAFVAPYVIGNQAHMCVQDYGWVSYGIDSSGNPQVYDFATFIDEGDGWGSE